MAIQVEEIVALAQEIDITDQINWHDLAVDADSARELMANNLLDQYQQSWQHLDQEDQARAMLAVMCHLVVENFVLNLKLHQ
jgi:capsule polysaccharide export protein KpsE/RkpR